MEQSNMIWIELARPIFQSTYDHSDQWLVFGTWGNPTRSSRALFGSQSQWWTSSIDIQLTWMESVWRGLEMKKQRDHDVLATLGFLTQKNPYHFWMYWRHQKRHHLLSTDLEAKHWRVSRWAPSRWHWLIDRTSSHHFLVDIFWVLYYTLSWLPACQRSVWTPQDASNVPAVEPALADAKPAEATEAVEVPWTCGRPMRKAQISTNDSSM